MNFAANGAERFNSQLELSPYLEQIKEEQTPIAQKVFGKQATTRINKMLTEATLGWASVFGRNNPLELRATLDLQEGPLAKHLTPSQRSTMRKRASEALRGLHKTFEEDAIKEGVRQNGDIYKAIQNNTFDAGMALSFERRNKEKRVEILLDGQLDEPARKKQLKILNEREEFLEIMRRTRWERLDYDVESNVAVLASLIAEHDKLFKVGDGKAGKDLLKWHRFQTKLAKAYENKEISRAHYNKMFNSMALVLGEAVKDEGEKDFAWWGTDRPRRWGNAEMNSLLATPAFRDLSQEARNTAWLDYMDQLDRARANNQNVTGDQTRAMALRALNLVAETLGIK